MSTRQTTRRDVHPMHGGPYLLLGALERHGVDYHYVIPFAGSSRGVATHAGVMLDSDHELVVPLDKPTGCFVRRYYFGAGNELVGSGDSDEFSVLAVLRTLREDGIGKVKRLGRTNTSERTSP